VTDLPTSDADSQPVDAVGPSDAELITAVRSGDTSAFGPLYDRHVGAARALARQLTRDSNEADDLVSEAFAKVLSVVQGGGGPDVAFRAYLLTTLRRNAYDRSRAGQRVQVSDDLTPYDPGVPFVDPALEGLERSIVSRAYTSLPERWQTVLWHTEVEGLSPAQVAPILGLTANGVAALAYRAREGLRQAYLQQHLMGDLDDECRPFSDRLGAYARGGLSKRETAQVEAHLETCRRCRGLVLELTDVGSGMRAVVAPLVLGIAAAGYLGSGALLGTGGAGAAAAAGFGHAAAGAAGATGAGTGAAGTGAAAAAGSGAAAAGTSAAGVTAGAAAAAAAAGVVGVGALAASTTPAAAAAAGSGAAGGAGAAATVTITGGAGGGGLLTGGWLAGAAAALVGLAGAGVVTAVVISSNNNGGSTSGSAPGATAPVVPGGSSSSGGPSTPGAGGAPSGTTTPGATDTPLVFPPPSPTDVPATVPSTAPSAQPSSHQPSTHPTATPTPTSSGHPTTSPTPTTSPSPTPSPTPTSTPQPKPVLAATLAPVGDLVAGRPGLVGFTVSNSGDGASGPVTATVALPPGVSFQTLQNAALVSQRGKLQSPRSDGAGAVVDGWSCERTDAGATCTRDAIDAGTTTSAYLHVVAAPGSAGTTPVVITITADGLDPVVVTGTRGVQVSGLSARYAATGSVTVQQVGNGLLSCAAASSGCTDARQRQGDRLDNDDWGMARIDGDDDPSTKASSAVQLDLPAGATIRWAGLYWSGAYTGSDTETIKLKAPGSTYQTLTSEQTDFGTERSYTAFQSYADVTALVQSAGGGTWWAADPLVKTGTTTYAGWALVVVRDDPGAPSNQVTVFDGFGQVSAGGDPLSFAVAARPGGPARLGSVAWEGDAGIVGDTMSLDGQALTPTGGSQQANNFADSSALGALGVTNTFGTDVDEFLTSFPDQGVPTITASTDGDSYFLGVLTVSGDNGSGSG
jgi:RNA polymerase sigma factor (sigma-70 family)